MNLSDFDDAACVMIESADAIMEGHAASIGAAGQVTRVTVGKVLRLSEISFLLERRCMIIDEHVAFAPTPLHANRAGFTNGLDEH